MRRSSNRDLGATRRILCLAALLIATVSPLSAQRADPVALASLQREFVKLAEKLTPAVVRVGKGYTGVIVDGRGYVLSDAAAVPKQTDPVQRVRIELASGRVFDARPVWKSSRSRTALLKITKGARFPCIPAGDSDALHVGEFVMTIGNAFNLASQGGQPSVTVGHVAGVWTAGPNDKIKIGRIVTTAALNPGTSGGPLIDIRGSLIGINDQRRGPGDMSQVVPINFIRESYAKCDEAYRVLSLGARKRGSPRRYAGYMDRSLTDLAVQVAPAVVAIDIERGEVAPRKKKKESKKAPKDGKTDDKKPVDPEKPGGKTPDEETPDKKKPPEKGPPEKRQPEKKPDDGSPGEKEPQEESPPPEKPGEPDAKPPGDKKPDVAKPDPKTAPAEKARPAGPPRPPRKERFDRAMPVDRRSGGAKRPRPRPRGKRPVFRMKRREDPVSGVIVEADGLVLTATSNLWESNKKKIKQIRVVLPDGRKVVAKRLGTDRARGITALRVEAVGLPVRPEVGPDETPIGTFVAVIGNPYGDRRVGSQPFLTFGVLSARNQINPAVAAYQTDALVNQVNQGGALVDTEGRLLGIPILYNPGRYGLNSGIGFVVPLWSIRRSLARLKKGEDVWPGYLGVRFPPVYEPEVRGVRIVKVVKHSPAERGGLQAGDCILRVDGARTTDAMSLVSALNGAIDGERLEVEVTRNGRIINLEIEAERRG